MKTILIVGNCGSGKTWVMKQLLTELNADRAVKRGLWHYRTDHDRVGIIGKYEGHMYDGSDRLSMALMKEALDFREHQRQQGLTMIGEGDRLMNKTFLKVFRPTIIKITDNGTQGRKLRKSNQSAQHLQRVQSRVNSFPHHYLVSNSFSALSCVLHQVNEES
jgi:ABC-type dipeptide/oligopeptide/nickel transport system ATPase component